MNAHPDTYVDRVPARFRDQAPRVEYTADPLDPFFNVNRPDDFAAAEAILGATPAERN